MVFRLCCSVWHSNGRRVQFAGNGDHNELTSPDSRACAYMPLQGGERAELQEFTALEYGIVAAEELSLRSEAEELRAASEAAAAELDTARGRLAEAEATLQQRDAEVGGAVIVA